MKKIIFSLIALSFPFLGCGNISIEKLNVQTETFEKLQFDGEDKPIELNNGKKWKVDANMIIHIRNMESDVLSYSKAEEKDHKLLTEKLQSNINLLTANCTMKGKAHDELHKWLLPYIDMVKKLSEAKGEVDAINKFEDIKTSFTTFNQYFQ